MHRRQKSKEEGDVPNDSSSPSQNSWLSTSSTPEPESTLQPPQRQRYRVQSTPSRPQFNLPISQQSISPGGFLPPPIALPNVPLTLGLQGHTHHSHVRTRSISSDSFSPPMPSPLSTSFVSPSKENDMLPSVHSPPQLSPTQVRRHSRIHSRNLSIFFPRPGNIPVPSIAEDGGQELELPDKARSIGSPPNLLQSAPAHRTLGEGFKFGRKSSESSLSFPHSANNLTARRGHHHKHSLSHNFFSFLEPGSNNTSSSPPITSASSWDPSTPFPQSAPHSQQTFVQSSIDFHPLSLPAPSNRLPLDALASSIIQFILGALIWVSGQKSGSLSCTGLGYWVVFDAFGIILSRGLPQYLARPSSKSGARLYGNARVETVALFSQSIYLIFASVYICKETIEHIMLNANEGGEGHHHHHHDDFDVIDFPKLSLMFSTLTIILSSFRFDNHLRLVDAIGNHLPFSRAYLRSLFNRSRVPVIKAPPTSKWGVLVTNPYSASSLMFSCCLNVAAWLVPSRLHRPVDLLLATLETVVTFSVAYPAAVALGKVLLQTAPPRGLISGRMESFLRIMRELERHPDIISIRPPHIWQLTPPSHGSYEKGRLPAETLIITLELHVNHDLDDSSIVQLTRWTWDRITSAIGGPGVGEVTVGIVRD